MAALSSRATRSSATAASRKISSQFKTDGEGPEPVARVAKRRPAPRRDASESDASADEETQDSDEPAPKRQKPQPSRANNKSKAIAAQLHQRLFGPTEKPSTSHQPCVPPTRRHGIGYHRSALLDDAASRDALLAWFDGVSTKRKMPWRKAWIDPREHSDAAQLRKLLERRAYEVWISEIMLQQTRVAVVIDYWNDWMAKWQTIHDLAAASPEDVLSAWRGLGYYSRATRIHEAAKLVVQDPDMMGLLPSRVEHLEAKVPGVGRYTAGAISAIVFGRAVPMVDGNVLRVLSRQLGLLGNVKTDKLVIDTLWAAAAALAKAVAQDGVQKTTDDDVSNRPGRWGQALMELGSTVCTPKPNCDQCPISSTCRAYEEGKTLVASARKPKMEDIEDLCHLCEPLEETPGLEKDEEGKGITKPASKENKQGKQMKLSAFMIKSTAGDKEPAKPKTALSAKDLEVIVDHARKFPLKVVKKAVRIEETLVCVIRRSDGQYLIQKRPEKGLLAGLWEFPSHILQDSDDNSTSKLRRTRATAFASDLIAQDKTEGALKHVRELDSVPWLFSHIKLTMHVHLFTLEIGDGCVEDTPAKPLTRERWASPSDIDKESMGTGMRKCWELAKDSD